MVRVEKRKATGTRSESLQRKRSNLGDARDLELAFSAEVRSFPD